MLSGDIVAGPHVRNACRRHLLDLKEGPRRGLVWDLEAALRAIHFFPDVLRLAGGQFEGLPFKLEPSQKFKVGSVFGWKREDGRRRFRRVYDEEGKGNGKALAIDTPIPTPFGWTTMGALRIGDEIFDAQEKSCNVTEASGVMFGRPCFRLQFDDGTTIVADAEHLWPVNSKAHPATRLVRSCEISKISTCSSGKFLSLKSSLEECGIVACDPIESVPVRCITVNAPSQLFLCGRGMVPTHNSPEAAGVGMYMLLADGESRAEVYAAGSKKDQAMVLFRDAIAMRDQSPALRARLTPSGFNPIWQLTDLRKQSWFKPISNEDSQSGPRPSCALVDELHEHRDRVVIEMLERGFKWRLQPILWITTNSGSDRKSVCYEWHEHAVRVAAGTRTPDEKFSFVGELIDDETFAFVCALDPGDDPLEDPACWPKANPLLDITIRTPELESAVRQGKALPGYLNNILRLHFCEWTDSETAWMARPTLEAVLADFDPAIEHAGKEVAAAVDLSATQDLTAVAFMVRTGMKKVERENGATFLLPTYDAWIEAFTPADTLRERALRDRAPYDVWERQGFLHQTPGKAIRLDFVAARAAEVNSIFPVSLLGYDQYSFRRFQQELEDLGLTLKTIWHPQGGQRRAKAPDEEIEEAKRRGVKPDDADWPLGLWMPGSLLELETLIFERRIRLRRNPVLISACMSAAVESDRFNNRWLSKAKATNRIDPAVSLCMACGVATRRKAAIGGPSVYESEGAFM